MSTRARLAQIFVGSSAPFQYQGLLGDLFKHHKEKQSVLRIRGDKKTWSVWCHRCQRPGHATDSCKEMPQCLYCEEDFNHAGRNCHHPVAPSEIYDKPIGSLNSISRDFSDLDMSDKQRNSGKRANIPFCHSGIATPYILGVLEKVLLIDGPAPDISFPTAVPVVGSRRGFYQPRPPSCWKPSALLLETLSHPELASRLASGNDAGDPDTEAAMKSLRPHSCWLCIGYWVPGCRKVYMGGRAADIVAAVLYHADYDPYEAVNKIDNQKCPGIFSKEYMEANPTVQSKPKFTGRKTRVMRKLARLRSNKNVTETQAKRQRKADDIENQPVVGIAHVEDLVHNDTNGGLTYYYEQCKKDPAFLAPSDRGSIIVCSTLTTAGFNVGTVRSSDKQTHCTKVIAEWNDPESDLEIFVANVNTMATGVNIYYCYSKGAFLNWHLNAKTMLRIVGRLVRIGQREQVIFHLLKVKHSYHDNMERLHTTKWATQLSAEIGLAEWLTNDFRECCVFEIIKMAWYQPFNRYAWVVAYINEGYDMKYHSLRTVKQGHVISIWAKLMMSIKPEEQLFWKDYVGFLYEGIAQLEGKFTLAKLEEYMEKDDEWLHKHLMPRSVAVFKELDKAEIEETDGHKKRARATSDRKQANNAEFIDEDMLDDPEYDSEEGEDTEDADDADDADGNDANDADGDGQAGPVEADGRLVRIGQKDQVVFHLLKVKHSYHDNVERLCTTKWATQLSAEIGLADWLRRDSRECCVFETIKTA
ncbi:hypothetical protein BKA56DRAFT_674161 [Ilyonectria sp. MPI-CAGE-AT-0026]|nr:hypothetical protein BKA56DRAFT_674161 [Ilyonectria sp. MPI-CAGE-AT-0026]